MRVALARQRRLHQQATIVAANAAAGMTSLCPKPYVPSRPNGSELPWQPMFIPDWLESAVSSDRFSREEKEMRLFPQPLAAVILTAGCYLSIFLQ
jgi:hypothetical protein